MSWGPTPTTCTSRSPDRSAVHVSWASPHDLYLAVSRPLGGACVVGPSPPTCTSRSPDRSAVHVSWGLPHDLYLAVSRRSAVHVSWGPYPHDLCLAVSLPLGGVMCRGASPATVPRGLTTRGGGRPRQL